MEMKVLIIMLTLLQIALEKFQENKQVNRNLKHFRSI